MSSGIKFKPRKVSSIVWSDTHIPPKPSVPLLDAFHTLLLLMVFLFTHLSLRLKAPALEGFDPGFIMGKLGTCEMLHCWTVCRKGMMNMNLPTLKGISTFLWIKSDRSSFERNAPCHLKICWCSINVISFQLSNRIRWGKDAELSKTCRLTGLFNADCKIR